MLLNSGNQQLQTSHKIQNLHIGRKTQVRTNRFKVIKQMPDIICCTSFYGKAQHKRYLVTCTYKWEFWQKAVHNLLYAGQSSSVICFMQVTYYLVSRCISHSSKNCANKISASYSRLKVVLLLTSDFGGAIVPQPKWKYWFVEN